MMTSSASDLRVVIIDSRADRRALMGYVVEICGPNLTVVGYAGSAPDALAIIDRERAGAAVVEIQMPVADGLEAITTLRRDQPAMRIVVCSFHHIEETRRQALERGADAYLTKPVSPRDLYRALAPTLSPSEPGHRSGDRAPVAAGLGAEAV